MTQKPYEVIAKCMMAGLPAGSDIVAFGERLEKVRRKVPGVVRATPQPPAVFRDGAYVLEARFVAWADDGESALRAAARLLDAALVTCSDLYLSGRALSEVDAPRPAAGRAAGKTAVPSKARTAAKGSGKRKAGNGKAEKGNAGGAAPSRAGKKTARGRGRR